MKKKIGIALVLALVAVLLFSTVALAAEPIELQSSNGGTAEWTDEEVAVGDYSVELDWPAPYWEDSNYIVPQASVAITDLADLTISEVNSWSYWANAPKSYCPNLTFYTDTVGDGDSDTTITAWPTNAPGDVWTQIDETTIGGYQGAYVVWGSNPWPSWKFDWSAVQSSYGDAEILDLLIGKGVIGTNKDITVYVDDFILNGVLYSFEPPPPPPVVQGPAESYGIPDRDFLKIMLPDGSTYAEYAGHHFRADIDFSDGTWRIQLSASTNVWALSGEKPTYLKVNEEGEIVSPITFKGDAPIITRL